MNATNHRATPGTIALCGAEGFIGQALARQLRAAGHTVKALSRRSTPAADFASLRSAQAWLPHLQGVDMVINAVGSLRGSQAAPLSVLHAQAPMALFDACAQAGITRVLQISALGVEGNPTDYARTKLQADMHLMQLTAQGQLQGLVVRPSLVIGARGASSQLFMRLARLPALLLPQPMLSEPIQPLTVQDLASALLRLLESEQTGVVELGGPERLSMAAMIASLRQQSGHRAALVHALPDWVSRASARMGDAVPTSPWCSASLTLASRANICDPAPLAHWLGQPATPPAQMLRAIQNDA